MAELYKIKTFIKLFHVPGTHKIFKSENKHTFLKLILDLAMY